jgi:hypothetical protein
MRRRWSPFLLTMLAGRTMIKINTNSSGIFLTKGALASARGRLSDQVEDLCKISVINFLKKYSQYIL